MHFSNAEENLLIFEGQVDWLVPAGCTRESTLGGLITVISLGHGLQTSAFKLVVPIYESFETT